MPEVQDPIQILITQGYPPDIAKKMVESGDYARMVAANEAPLPGAFPITPGAFPNISKEKAFEDESEYSDIYKPNQFQKTNSGKTSPEIQGFLDQGYNQEEAEQLAQATSVNQGGNYNTDDLSKILDFGAAYSGGVSDLETSAYGLGQAIGAEKGTQGRGLNIAANAGKLIFSGARNVASGIGQAKRSQHMQEFADKKRQEALGRELYIAAPQTSNSNYLGGNSYGEEGGTQGENLPLKKYLSNKGFRKPGYKKLK